MLPDYEAHHASMIFPMIGEADLAELAEDIRQNGLLEPIGLHEGKILDGRNRMAACKLAGVLPRFVSLEGIPSPTIYVVSKNLHRRHLTTSQRAAIAAQIVPMLQEEAKQRERRGVSADGTAGGRGRKKNPGEIPSQGFLPNDVNHMTGKARDIAGKAVGVSGWTVQGAMRVKEAHPEEFERIKRGETTVGAALRKVGDRDCAPNKRQQVIQNAAKRRMIEILTQARSMCRGLPTFNFSALRSACTPEEIHHWASSAREASKHLRLFASKLVVHKED